MTKDCFCTETPPTEQFLLRFQLLLARYLLCLLLAERLHALYYSLLKGTGQVRLIVTFIATV